MKQPPWLDDAFARVEALLGARLPHALLIQGPGGWGEELVANALAAKIVGLDPGADMREVAHPDLRWREPEDGVLKIDAVRQVIEFLVQTPQLALRKVAVFRDAERMNANAANALLKTLEEPPEESFLVLVSGAPERLLPTVRSRCQRIALRGADTARALAWLAEMGVDADAARYFAVEYGGAPFAVLRAAQREQAPLWPTLAAAGRAAAPSGVAELAEQRRDEDLADFCARWLRVVHWLARRTPGAGTAALLGFGAELMEVRRAALFNTGLNRPMQIERLLLLWAAVFRRIPEGDEPKAA